MLRRKWLEFVLGASAAVIVGRDWLVGLVEAKELSAPQGDPPKTVAAAIKTHKAAEVASFILTYPTAARAASIQQKGTMVYLLGVCPMAGAVWETAILSTEQQRHERAALTILRGIESRTDIAEVVRIVGGRQVVESKVPQILTPELKTLAQTFLKR
jgi:hypothetical protein